MNYLSVCSGIEAATVAWHPLGWNPVAFSEIERFPSNVLAHHYPQTPNLGDMNEFKKWPDTKFDVLVGGTPCQSFSVAGLRQGLDDPRGNLALTFCAILSRYSPTWFVWENVPGVLSSERGRDFGSLIGAMVKLGYGIAYRVLDAQYFGVPQRRRRVFVVGYLGDWRRAAQVLFEPESLLRNPAPSRETGQRVARSLAARTRGGGGLGTDTELDGGLIPDTVGALTDGAHCGGGLNGQDAYSGRIFPVAHALRAEGFDASEDGTGRGTPIIHTDIMPTMQNGADTPAGHNARSGHTKDNYIVPMAFNARQDPDSYGNLSGPLDSDGSTIAFAQNQRDEVRVSHTLYNKGFNDTDNDHASAQKTDAASLLSRVRQEIGEEVFTEWGLGVFDSLQPSQILRSTLHGAEFRQATFSRRWVVCCALGSPFSRAEGAMRSLREACGERRPSQGWGPLEQQADELGAYMSQLSQPGAQAARLLRDLWAASEGPGLLRQALSAIQEMGRPNGNEGQPAHTLAVRRLTADECEFLQGFPRGYTNIPGASDSGRYKALGNSMAVPCMFWIGNRIDQADRRK